MIHLRLIQFGLRSINIRLDEYDGIVAFILTCAPPPSGTNWPGGWLIDSQSRFETLPAVAGKRFLHRLSRC
jgi:hypothetical protein